MRFATMDKILYGVIFTMILTSSVGAFEQKIVVESKPSLAEIISTQRFSLLGETTFSIFFWDLYKSKLMTTSGQYPINLLHDSLLFHIRYLADISRKDLIKRTVEQWQHLGFEQTDYQHYLADLNRLWPDIKAGDSLALFVRQNHSSFYFNNKFLGDINDPRFGQVFIDIWLSEQTSQPELRRALLGINKHGN